MLTNYTEAELSQMITNQIEENLHLDYKGAGSLAATDGKKKEIAKDISAFANSDGGIVIYGMLEHNDKAKSHLPEKLDPIDRTVISKEWLEQVINSNIQPKIIGLTIHPIPLASAAHHVAYVVKIPKSNTAHQASDKKYYKRYNFESVAMEDYEIKDILNRLSSPDLNLILDSAQITFDLSILKFPIILRNNSKRLAKDVKFMIEFLDFQNYNCQQLSGFADESHLNVGRKIYSTNQKIEIYNGIDTYLGDFQLTLNENISSVIIKSTICCDNMSPSIYTFGIEIQNDIPTYIYINSIN
jgi:Putative DNA-binding domain